MKKICFIALLLPLLSFARSSRDFASMPKKMDALKKETKEGWTPKLILGFSYSLTDSEAWVGSDEGSSQTVGLNIKGNYDLKHNQHEWRNSLAITEASSKSPTLPTWIKSSDDLKIETTYLYSLENYSWMGPYAKASAQTSIFKGESVTSTPKNYTLPAATDPGLHSVIRLTDGFKPLTTKESVGAFFKLIKKKKMSLEARVGLGALQVNAGGQLAKDSTDSVTGDVVLKELSSYNQIGLELGIDFKGNLDKKTVYDVGIEALIPFSNDDIQDRDALELMDWEAHAKITTKLYEMLSMSYEYKIREQPELLDKVQTQHLLLANLTYTLF